MDLATVSWETFQPIADWVLVKADPRIKKTVGGIILTDELTKIERVMAGSGRILKCGPKAMVDVEPGERICYRGFLKDACHASFKRDEDDCQIFMLKVTDVLMIIPDTTVVGHITPMGEQGSAAGGLAI